MFLANIKLIFRGSVVEITTAILLVYIVGLQQIYSESRMTVTDTNNQVHLTEF
jgi:hypothetical protein